MFMIIRGCWISGANVLARISASNRIIEGNFIILEEKELMRSTHQPFQETRKSQVHHHSILLFTIRWGVAEVVGGRCARIRGDTRALYFHASRRIRFLERHEVG